MHYDFDEVHNRLGTYCTQWDYIEDRFNKKDLIPFSIIFFNHTNKRIIHRVHSQYLVMRLT